MSFVKARQRSTEVAAATEHHGNKCAANGCPLRGTIEPNGGRYVCVYHYTAQPDQWPRATEALHQHRNIIMGIDEVINTSDIDWSMGKWQMMERFFDGEPDLQPTEAERKHRRWYEYRLHTWLLYLTGGVTKRPEPRKALEPVKRRGNLGALLGGV